MKKIGLLSDTHGYILPRLYDFFKDVDEIWHAGDIGNLQTADSLNAFKPLRAVSGNIDDYLIRMDYPEIQNFECEGLKVVMMHIGGYPGNYSVLAKMAIKESNPGMFISGHSHILKVIFDKKNDLLHLNPGAAGNSGMHRHITAMRFTIDEGRPAGLEILEIPR